MARRAPLLARRMSGRARLDVEMVRRGLVESRTRAQSLIEAREVLVSGAVAENVARRVAPNEPVELMRPKQRFVSRGGLKLEAALDVFALDVRGHHCLDVGASTGGFTDCLLQRGAGSVLALDVGRNQLHEKLRTDARVNSIEQLNVREATLVGLESDPFELVTADLSFISLRTVAPVIAGTLAAPGADLVFLIKPQFEAGRQEVAKGRGVVTDPVVWRRVLVEVVSAMSKAGAATMGLMVSPVLGGEGNVEFLGWFRAHTEGPEQADEVFDAVVRQATNADDS